MILLDPVGTDKLTKFIDQNTDSLKALVTQIASGLDIKAAHASPKMFNLKSRFGKGMVIKILCAVIHAFCNSIKASKTMDAIDTIECAELLEEKYSHESVKDIILALKTAKMKGTKFYNAIDVSVIMAICDEYFESKTTWLEAQNSTPKTSQRDERYIAQFGFDNALEARKTAISEKEQKERQERLLEIERMKVEMYKAQNDSMK